MCAQRDVRLVERGECVNGEDDPLEGDGEEERIGSAKGTRTWRTSCLLT